MELRLIYRILRKVSDWTLDGFYSEVYIDGSENVPKDGPLILTSTHHNEMIDIAALAATIPYRRHVSFWAKSSMFANFITRGILNSANAIPVKRNPDRVNGLNGHTNGTSNSSSSSSDLFKESCIALEAGQVIGIFAEGTSYTQPHIMQIKEGAGWVAIEYTRWIRAKGKGDGTSVAHQRPLLIVPVGVVYTDKSQYQSRVSVKYGKPISMDAYFDEILASDGNPEAQRAIVKKIMAEVERNLVALSINAPDWDTLYAARTARDILWDDEDIPLRNYTRVSQTLADILSPSFPHTCPETKASLIKYFSLLHHTSMSHTSLNAALPYHDGQAHRPPSTLKALYITLKSLTTLLLHPKAVLFLPAFLVHLPAYILGPLSVKLLATPGEEEGPAQFKSILGGLGIGIGSSFASLRTLKWFTHANLVSLGQPNGLINGNEDLMKVLVTLQDVILGREGKLKRLFTTLGMMFGMGYALVRWHNALVKGNYRRWKNFVVSCKLLLGTIFSRTLPSATLALYTQPPPPPKNVFIKSDPLEETRQDSAIPRSSQVSTLRLIGHLLVARVEAVRALKEYLKRGGVAERFGEAGLRPRSLL